jgi:hypothetical protein
MAGVLKLEPQILAPELLTPSSLLSATKHDQVIYASSDSPDTTYQSQLIAASSFASITCTSSSRVCNRPKRHSNHILAQFDPKTAPQEFTQCGLEEKGHVEGVESSYLFHHHIPSDWINVHPDDRITERIRSV